ncbi:epidermal growth factor receptor isoform X1 [Metopolophium dirhodum]|uniref:epidermal growth factor receptor isoform X1 n=1 Tax=Metopolophium dirhodum TaxID=44670 RepID=UPI00298F77B1|nr:epidermal growth factor receptor isoform X1 [Metopolophium dirhodum]XP_060869379.1 epidermal growth factor receptor isoform X1 [Metopolophium dirhodum]
MNAVFPSVFLRRLWRCRLLLVAVLVFHAATATVAAVEKTSEFVKGKICIGTNGRLSVPSNRDHHYRNLRDRYTNCTYVDGNLELTWLQDEHLDLSFLQHIREVTGYVLITHVDVNKIVLPRLQIIRGRTQFKLAVKEEEFSLLVMLSKMNNLELPALRDILAGNVGMIDNYNLCHMRTINWDEIITGPGAKWMYMYNFSNSERECPPCDKSCTGGCWGEGPHNCQKFSKINCSPQCYQGRCFGPKPRDCCHLFCAGGCTGPKQSDCLACRNFYDDGVCTQECPAMQRYNSITYSWETNPNGKYAYGATCVKNCPEHLLKDNGACVRSCPPKKKAVNGECVLCDGPCPKTCEGVTTIHDSNIDGFKDCTVIEGSLTILDQTFKGFQQVFANFSFGQRIKAMNPDRLEVFSTLKEVTGYINIQGSHEDFKNLSYFRNLEVIGGRTVTEYFASLYIVKTSLTSLGLRSLKKIHSGSVAILENKRLCYAQTIDWESIKKSSEHPKLLQNNKNESLCILENEICDPECSKQGCWGPGPHQCLSCRNFQYDNQCLPNCNHIPGLYEAGDKTCLACHPECNGGCHGPGPEHCTTCRNLLDGIHCVSQCPVNKYSANQTRPSECLPCHLNCVGGCSGPDNTIGPNGCRSCHKAVLNADASVERCLHKNETCPNGYYYEWVGPLEQGGAALRALAGKAVCRKCHPRCLRCTGFGFHDQVCQRCAGYKRGDHCADDCPIEYYATTNKLPNGEIERECMPCDILCRGCYGPHASQCQACRHFKIFEPSGNPSDNRTAFNCSGPICPSFAPYKVYTKDDPDPYCSADDVRMASKLSDSEQIPLILSAVVVFTFLVMVLLMILVWHWRRRARAKETAVKMTMVLTGMEDNEPLRPSNVKPNTAKLRIVKEVDLRIGAELGNGAFGVVYKGVWVVEGENIKIPVAIKKLHKKDDTCGYENTSKEFLDEAYIMASVEHDNLVKLLAVCMTSEMMLVTQLMPLGCLLKYVRNNNDKIGSKTFLKWCTQIAKGMAYLEEKRLVHRDLAARNVLVQNTNCVKITDFGLAKLLEIDQLEYTADGGKMPVKWLAPECLKYRVFTHKSDVWAFGITVWELLTYGKQPYESVDKKEVLGLLEKGERLPQPPICTIDVYMVMVKCWLIEKDSRPSFEELADEFAKMAIDPGRYLVIPGDRYMRLPSYSSQDENEILSNLATEGADMSIMEADEYCMNPKMGNSMPGPSRLGSSSTAGADMLGSMHGRHNWDRELRKFGDIHRLDCDTSDDLSNGSKAQVGTLKLDLPLDEDDYLMPSPANDEIDNKRRHAPANYIDLIGHQHAEAEYANGSLPRPPGLTKNFQPDFLPVQVSSVDNPEYHLTGGEPSAAAPSTVSGDGSGSVEASCEPQSPAPTSNGRSLEDESDHEYYNDFDRLQRELQPLRRNETTV